MKTIVLAVMLLFVVCTDGRAVSAEGSAAHSGAAAGSQAKRFAPEQWKPLAQPQLAQDFAKARPVETEDICDGPDMCYVDTGPRYWIPNRDGKSWDAVLFYSANYMGPHEVNIFDFGTGRLKLQKFEEVGGQTHMFHLRGTRWLNGKMVVQSYTYGQPAFWVYDPEANEMKFLGNVTEGKFTDVSSWVVAEDGTIYGVGQMRSGGVGCYRIDTTTWKGEVIIENVGPNNKNMVETYAKYDTEGDWVYAAIGHTPWRLYGFNTRTRRGLVIAESAPVVGDVFTMQFRSSDYAAVKLKTALDISGIGAPGTYWLKDGKVLKGEGENPPPSIPKRKPNDKQGKYMGNEPHNPPPDIECHRTSVDNASNLVRYWYRLKGKALEAAQSWGDEKVKTGDWGKIEFPVTFYPQPVRRMLPLPDGRILTLTDSYGRALMIDPVKRTRQVLGSTMDVHTLTLIDDKIYLCGYASSTVQVYDPAKPWTLNQTPNPDQPPVPRGSAPGTPRLEPNPRHVTQIRPLSNVHAPDAAVGPTPDGRIYFGGFVTRVGNGGGLGWWDFKEQKPGGLHEPFSGYPIHWMCGADNNRYLVISTKTAPDDTQTSYTPPRGKLFVFDTATHRIIHGVEADFWWTPGYVTEALPGLVMGYAAPSNDASAQGGVLYGFDPAAGHVLWSKPVPHRPETARSRMTRGAFHFSRGPDGHIWATMAGVLARIEPVRAEVEVLGKLPDTALAFSQGEVYVGGAAKLRRLVTKPRK